MSKANEGHPPSSCSAVDNTFESVLWRRLAPDLRLPTGWCFNDMERHFRETVRKTLAECPPNNMLSVTGERGEPK